MKYIYKEHKINKNKITNDRGFFTKTASIRGVKCQVTCATCAYKGCGGRAQVILSSFCKW